MARDEWLEAFEHLVDGSIEVATVEMDGIHDYSMEFRDSCREALEMYASRISDDIEESLHPIERRILRKIRDAVQKWRGPVR